MPSSLSTTGSSSKVDDTFQLQGLGVFEWEMGSRVAADTEDVAAAADVLGSSIATGAWIFECWRWR